MAIPELELKRAEKFLAEFRDSVPPYLRVEIDYRWRIRGNQITLFVRRPAFMGKAGDYSETNFARFLFRPETHNWLLKWSDRNGRFHLYEQLEPGHFERLIEEVRSDPTGIFLG